MEEQTSGLHKAGFKALIVCQCLVILGNSLNLSDLYPSIKGGYFYKAWKQTKLTYNLTSQCCGQGETREATGRHWGANFILLHEQGAGHLCTELIEIHSAGYVRCAHFLYVDHISHKKE